MDPNIKSILPTTFSSAIDNLGPVYIVLNDNDNSAVPASLICNKEVYGSLGYCIKKIVDRHWDVYRNIYNTFFHKNINPDNNNLIMRED